MRMKKKKKVVVFLNEKGGVGKTTTAVHVAAGMAIRGYRVLLIDSDPQGNATSRLALHETPALYDLIVRRGEWNRLMVAADPVRWAGEQPIVDGGSLTVLPNNIETRQISGAVGDDIMRFKKRIDELEGFFDIVIIDTSPTPSLLHSMIYMATDIIVYPTQCQYLALEGLGKSMAHIKLMNESRAALNLPQARLGGVIPTMYDSRTEAHQRGMKRLKTLDEQGCVLPALRDLTIWKKVEYARRTIFAHAPGSPAERDMWSVIDALKLG